MSLSGFNFSIKSSGGESDSTKSDPKSKYPQDTQKNSQNSLKGSFESLGSVELGFSASKKCYICSKNFNFRKKHFCKFCQNAVCSDHSAKTRTKEGFTEPQRICDLCDQEEEKTVIKSEIDDEVSNLSEELKQAKDTNERLYRDHFEKTASVNQLEEELATAETEHTVLMRELTQDIERKQEQKAKALEALARLKEQLKTSKQNQSDFESKTIKSSENISDLQSINIDLHKSLEIKHGELEKVDKFLQENVSVEPIIPSLCSRCSTKISDALQGNPYLATQPCSPKPSQSVPQKLNPIKIAGKSSWDMPNEEEKKRV